MKNPFKNTTFLFGVTKYQKLPEDTGTEILLSGRSNAGKSSALNSLTKNKKLARISKTPGRTTEINFFEVKDDFKLLDLPGYGFAKSGHSRRKDWGPLLGEYFKKRESLKAVIVFMDIRHPLKPIDLEMIALCKNYGVPYISVLTKADKVSKNICFKTINDVIKETKNSNVIATSCLSEAGFDELRKKLMSLDRD
jgi:GTP-binding protein